MITLYVFGPYFGLPDGSPFVTKTLVTLKLAGLAYQTDATGFGKAPKGKLPFIKDDGKIIADSTLIRFHIEEKYGIDLDAGLTPAERGAAWAVEKMCEEHLYWAIIDARWMIDANFDKGPRQFFAGAPAPLRPLIAGLVRGQVRKAAKGHGMGRHARADIEKLAIRDLKALSDILGDKPYLMGDKPCWADATVYAFVAGALTPAFETPIRTAAEGMANLVAYRDRLTAQYFPA